MVLEKGSLCSSTPGKNYRKSHGFLVFRTALVIRPCVYLVRSDTLEDYLHCLGASDATIRAQVHTTVHEGGGTLWAHPCLTDTRLAK